MANLKYVWRVHTKNYYSWLRYRNKELRANFSKKIGFDIQILWLRLAINFYFMKHEIFFEVGKRFDVTRNCAYR